MFNLQTGICSCLPGYLNQVFELASLTPIKVKDKRAQAIALLRSLAPIKKEDHQITCLEES